MSQLEPYPLSNYPQTGRLESGQVVPQGMTDEQASHVVPIENTNAFTSEELQDMACTVGGCGVCGRVVNYLEFQDSSKCKTTLNSSCESILVEADKVAGQERSRDYGHPYHNHRRIADMWNIQLEKKLSEKITPREVGLMMIALKLAREINSPKRDNLIDAAGYVKCVDMIDEFSRMDN